MAKEDVEVYSLALDCQSILEDLASQNLNDDEVEPERLADTLGDRLNAWGNYLGVFALGPASLDRRLQNSPKVKESITQSLSQLHRTLQILTGKAPGTTGNQSSLEQGHLQSENNGDRRLLYEAADRTVDRLERFGRMVQRSSITEIQNRMELYAKDDADPLMEDPSAMAVQSKHRDHPAPVQAKESSPMGDLTSVQRRRTPTAENWDGPYFHEEYGLWFRQKPDINESGGIKYEWIGPKLPGQEEPDPETTPQIDKTTNDLGDLTINENATVYSGKYDNSYLPQDPSSDYTYKGKEAEETAYTLVPYHDTKPVDDGLYNANVPAFPTYDSSGTYPYGGLEDPSQNVYRESEQTAERFHRPGPSKSAQVSTPPVHQVPLLGGNSRGPFIEETARPDEQYRVERSSRWKKGEVIKCLHAEYRGGQKNRYNSLTESREHSSLDSFYVGPRRFIIVKTSYGRSTCVPILTYGKQGCRKPGLLPQTHSVAYSSNLKPRLLPGEPQLGFPAIAVDMAGTEVLAMESRVDYSNLKTFEHNIPVIFIGTIQKEAQAILTQAVDDVWADDQYSIAGPSNSRLKSRRK